MEKNEFSGSILKGFQKLLIGTTFGGDFFKSSSSNIRLNPPPSQPIIIHNLSGRNEKWIGTLIQLAVGAGLLWGSFAVFSNFLPDAVKELLPVTKRVFDTAVESLGNGIINLKDVLSQQILGLEAKQDEFSDKLDNAHEDILHIRSNVDGINDMVVRCEESLSIGEKRQKYTVRGMRLLLRCVGSILPANSTFNHELELFQYAGADLMGNDDDDNDKFRMTTPLKNSRLITANNMTSNTPYSRMNSSSDSVDGQSQENENPMMNATPSKFHHVDKMMDVIFTKSGKKLNYGVKVQ